MGADIFATFLLVVFVFILIGSCVRVRWCVRGEEAARRLLVEGITLEKGGYYLTRSRYSGDFLVYCMDRGGKFNEQRFVIVGKAVAEFRRLTTLSKG